MYGLKMWYIQLNFHLNFLSFRDFIFLIVEVDQLNVI